MTLISIDSVFNPHSAAGQGKIPSRKCSLTQIHPGCRAKILSFSPKISADRRAHLQAYGLLPGHWVRVIQHAPVTVLELNHMELALETELAGEIQVDGE